MMWGISRRRRTLRERMCPVSSPPEMRWTLFTGKRLLQPVPDVWRLWMLRSFWQTLSMKRQSRRRIGSRNQDYEINELRNQIVSSPGLSRYAPHFLHHAPHLPCRGPRHLLPPDLRFRSPRRLPHRYPPLALLRLRTPPKRIHHWPPLRVRLT